MRTIKLYGELGRRFGKVHRLSVKTAGEAIRALCANFPDFRKFMGNAHHEGVGFHVIVGRTPVNEYERVNDPTGGSEIIKIIPATLGAGSGWVKALIGAVLIVAGVLIPGAQPLIYMGAGLILSGIAQMLTKPPGAQNIEETKNKTSYIFNGPVNTAAQGGAIPVGYGTLVVGSTVISAGIETFDEL